MAGQRRQFNASLKRLRRKHPQAEVVFQQKAVSKDIHVVTQLRKDKVIKTKHNYFAPINMTEEQLIESIYACCDTLHAPHDITSLNAILNCEG